MHKLYLILLAGLFFVATGCSKSDKGEITRGGNPPVNKPAGQPIDNLQSFPIGPEGGEFKSADGHLSVIVPAGAVNEITNFQVQSITNTSDAGIGNGYRLLPHGANFEKPVTLSFSYNDILDSIPSEETLSIAYQSQDGIWHMVRPHVLNKTNKTIETPTTHFSDWILVSWLKLEPVAPALGTGEQITLRVLNFHPYSDDLLAPLVDSDNSTLPLGEGKPVPANFVKKWQLTGPGSLNGSGNNALYKAPGNVNGEASATAVAELKSANHQLLLLSNIRILGEGIRYRKGGGDWRTIPGHVGTAVGEKMGLAGEDDVDVLTIIWTGSSGLYNWSYEGGACGMTLVNQELSQYYVAFYEVGNGQVLDSGGSIEIDNWGPVGTMVTGRFSVSPSGIRSGATGKQTGTETVEGSFRVKRIK